MTNYNKNMPKFKSRSYNTINQNKAKKYVRKVHKWNFIQNME